MAVHAVILTKGIERKTEKRLRNALVIQEKGRFNMVIKRGERKDKLCRFSEYDFECSVTSLIHQFQILIDDHSEHYDFRLELDVTYDYDGETREFVMTATREETDEELAKRKAIAAKKKKATGGRVSKKATKKRRKKASEVEELAEYERLKKKFEK